MAPKAPIDAAVAAAAPNDGSVAVAGAAVVAVVAPNDGKLNPIDDGATDVAGAAAAESPPNDGAAAAAPKDDAPNVGGAANVVCGGVENVEPKLGAAVPNEGVVVCRLGAAAVAAPNWGGVAAVAVVLPNPPKPLVVAAGVENDTFVVLDAGVPNAGVVLCFRRE